MSENKAVENQNISTEGVGNIGAPELAATSASNEETATPLEIGQTLSEAIDFAGDSDTFSVELVAGQSYALQISSTDFDPDVYLTGPDAVTWDSDFGPDNLGRHDEVLLFTANTTGTYYLEAKEDSDVTYATEFGDYTLSIETYEALPERTVDDVAHFLTHEYWEAQRWATHEITFDVSGLTSGHQDYTRSAFEAWADISGLSFTEVTGTADITFQNSTDGLVRNAQWGVSNTLGAVDADGYREVEASIVNIDPSAKGSDYFSAHGSDYLTFLQATASALGLGRAGTYDDATYLQYSASGYGANSYLNDSQAFTVMSHFTQYESGYGAVRSQHAPKLADINAIQDLYGANSNGTNSGDTSYGFGPIDYEGTINQFIFYTEPRHPDDPSRAPERYARSMTLYDTDGVDTINLTLFYSEQVLDLNPGAFSDLGSFGVGNTPFGSTPPRHSDMVISIEENTIIENAILGSASDTAYGNAANNIIRGNAGDDTMFGGAGDDQLIVDLGTDFVQGDSGNDTFIIEWRATGATVADFTIGEDKLDLTDFSFDAVMDAFNNRVAEPSGTTITIEGFRPLDIVLQGVESENLSLSDILYVDPATLPPDVPGDLTTTATIGVGESVDGEISDESDADWFAVELSAGQRYEVTLVNSNYPDQHPAYYDPFLGIMDASGELLYSNDRVHSSVDAGVLFYYDSYIAFVPEVDGTYYLSAGSNTTRGSYTLSVEDVGTFEEIPVDDIAYHLIHPDNGAQPNRWDQDEISFYLYPLSQSHQLFARAALEAWGEISGLNFVETNNSYEADIDFYSARREAGGSWSPSTLNLSLTVDEPIDGYGAISHASIRIPRLWESGDYGDNPLDNFVYQTFLHMTGRALGLTLPGPYFGDYVDLDQDVTYSALGDGSNAYLNDSWAYSVNSYFDQIESGYGDFRYVLGPQIADIQAIMDLYGANPNGTHAGDTTYGFNSTEDGIEDWSTFTVTTDSGVVYRPPAMSIHDTGGIDTIDLSGFSSDQILRMDAGAFSDLGDRLIDGNENFEGVISIGENTIIENAILGSGNDVAYGNAANNIITGGLGNDYLIGGAGDDQLIVDYGHDLLQGDSGSDTFTVLSTAEAMTVDDFTVGEDKLDLTDFSREAVVEAFENRITQVFETAMLIEGVTLTLSGFAPGTFSLSDILMADPEPTSDLNEIVASSALEYLRGTVADDAFVFGANTSTLALGADRILDWNPGDVIDVSGMGFSEGELELVQNGNRLRLRQTDGSDDFHALIFNGIHSIEEIYSSIVYDGSTPPPPPPTNTAPTATDDAATTQETAPVAIDVLANDSDTDGDALSVSAFGQASNGTVTQLANGQLQYVANAGFVGTDTFTYTVSDENGGSDVSEVSITVEAGDVPPPPPTNHNEIIATSTLEYLRGTAADDAFIFDANTSTIALGADRILDWNPGDVIDVSALGFSEGDLELVQNGNRLRLRQTDGSDDFHALIFNGTHSIEDVYAAIVYDGSTPPPPPSNTAPIAADDSATTAQTAPVTLDVLANDSDADGDALNVSEFEQASNGTVIQLANGQLQYVANAGFVGTDTFTYTVSDGNGEADEGEVTITVEAGDVPPPPPTNHNEIIATSTLEYLRGTAADDAFIFGADTSTIALGADRILDWNPGDIIDVSALGFSEGELELVQNGNRLRLRQTDGSDDFHAFIFNGEHSVEDVYAAIIYSDSASTEPASASVTTKVAPVSEPISDPFITLFETPLFEYDKSSPTGGELSQYDLETEFTVILTEDGWSLA